MKNIRRTAKAIIEISHELHNLNDFKELPQSLEKTLSKYLPIDWMGLYRISSDDTNVHITTNPHLPFDWNQRYQEIAPYDNFAASMFAMQEGDAIIYHHFPDKMSEKSLYAYEFAKATTNTEQFMGITGLKDTDRILAYGFYRSDKNEPFIDADKDFLLHLSPLIVSVSKNMELYRAYDYKRTVIDNLLADESVTPAVFDENLVPVEIGAQTLRMIGRAFGKKNLAKIPKQIEEWIHQTIAPKGRLFQNTGPFSLKLDLPGGHLCCYAYILKTKQNKLVLLIRFRLHETTEDFSILKQKGLTPREITALEYLPLGYSNKQIAIAMGIEEVSVKKHLKNVALKLCTANKTETLYQALQERNILRSLCLK